MGWNKKKAGTSQEEEAGCSQQLAVWHPHREVEKRVPKRSNVSLLTLGAFTLSAMATKYKRVRRIETKMVSWLYADAAMELLLACPQSK